MNLSRQQVTVLGHVVQSEIVRADDFEYRRVGSPAEALTDEVYALEELGLVALHGDGRVTATVIGVRLHADRARERQARRRAEVEAVEAERYAQPTPAPRVRFSDPWSTIAARRAALVADLGGALPSKGVRSGPP